MTATNAEVGRVTGDDLLHAVKPGISGATAHCGAGRIAARVPGRFEEGLEGACPVCRRATGG